MERKKYTAPELEIIKFDTEDVITKSNIIPTDPTDPTGMTTPLEEDELQFMPK